MDSWDSVVTLDNGDRTELSSDSCAYGILQLITADPSDFGRRVERRQSWQPIAFVMRYLSSLTRAQAERGHDSIPNTFGGKFCSPVP